MDYCQAGGGPSAACRRRLLRLRSSGIPKLYLSSRQLQRSKNHSASLLCKKYPSLGLSFFPFSRLIWSNFSYFPFIFAHWADIRNMQSKSKMVKISAGLFFRPIIFRHFWTLFSIFFLCWISPINLIVWWSLFYLMTVIISSRINFLQLDLLLIANWTPYSENRPP